VPVVDASVVVTMLIDAKHASWAETQLSATGAGRSLWAPHLIDAEVGQALRRQVAAGRLDEDQAGAALLDLTLLPLRRIDHVGLLDQAWQLRHNLSFYDGLYVALAEMLGAPLITLDVRLAKAVATTAGVGVRAIAPG
jgi:predicted nucleic acid-binding protein